MAKNEPKDLAKIVDTGELASFAQMDDFLVFLNQQPPSIFIEKHPMAKGVDYIPIEHTELTLDKIFQYWYVEILDTKQILNAVAVTIRLFYKHPISQEWLHQDGVGAVAIQTDKGETAANLAAVKSDAIMKALPAAKSFAIKDAADHIGNIFGRNLNRKHAFDFNPSYGTDKAKAKIARDKAKIKKNLGVK